MAENYEYLGKALGYPVTVNQFGRVKTVVGIDAVKASIIQLLGTPVGFSFFLPERGSRLHLIAFEPADDLLASLLETLIFEAIDNWEKRVQTIKVTPIFYPDDLKVDCQIECKILQSNEIFSFIYPFYRELKY